MPLSRLQYATRALLHRDETARRRTRVIALLCESVFPRVPHIIDGQHSWIRDDGRQLPIDLLFHTMPLAVSVHGREREARGATMRRWLFGIDRAALLRADAILAQALEARGVPHLIVTPEVPLEVEVLRDRTAAAIRATRYG